VGEEVNPLLYQRPGFVDDPAPFQDLVRYAPGMNSNALDLDAVLDAEALPEPHVRRGKIDPAARALFDRARAAGWQAWTTGQPGGISYTIVFDGAGRYACERTLPRGPVERVVSDGETLLHLYPQLGLGARRTVSRVYRADLADRVPWALPPVEDLALGADVRLIAKQTVAIAPHRAAAPEGVKDRTAPQFHVHLVFADDGRVCERRVVAMPKGEIVLRQLCTAAGVVRTLDGAGKELHVRKGTLAPAQAPDLLPDTKRLVVLPLPYRTPEHVRRALKIENKGTDRLRFDEALLLLAAEFAAGNGAEVQRLFRDVFHARDQRPLGFYVLLAACGLNLEAGRLDVSAEHPDDPVAAYLALHSSPLLRKHASQWAASSGQWRDGLLQHLAMSHAIYQRWQNTKILKSSPARFKAEVERALGYVRRYAGTDWGWALLLLVQERAGTDWNLHGALADYFPLFESVPGVRYAARYEAARSLWRAGKVAQARERFVKLYVDTVRDGLLPAIDSDFRLALLGDGDRWSELLRGTAAKLIERKRRPAVFALARQCWQLEDGPLANQLLASALHGIADEDERLGLSVAGVQFLWETAQLPQADRLLRELLAHKEWGRRSALWRLAGYVAVRRDQTARAPECLERALELEHAEAPEAVDVLALRQDYGGLLAHYQTLADAMVTLKMQPPADFLSKVVRAADRWRAVDPEQEMACQAAARILQRLGVHDLSWDYLTTPVALRPHEAAPWVGLAQTLNQKGDVELADRAYAAAFDAEPTNAQILWDRAQNLRLAGQTVAAGRLLRQLAEGRWQPRFAGLQAQAKAQLQTGP
jgi:tetratricopeptide (TPR) repeat protein